VKRLSDRLLQLGVLFALVGMSLGAWMGKTGDFQLASVHAHINLLGWVSMLIYGLVYRVLPNAAEGRLPTVHFWLALGGLLILVPALWGYMVGGRSPPVIIGLAVGATGVWVAMLLFAVIIFRATWRNPA
jgi:drug/metabolite transporter superfamily protein YnfA